MKELMQTLTELIVNNGGLVVLSVIAIIYGGYAMHRQQKDHEENKKDLAKLRERFDSYQEIDRKRTDELMKQNVEAMQGLKSAIEKLIIETTVNRELAFLKRGDAQRGGSY
jgi:uncharacterized protein HemX